MQNSNLESPNCCCTPTNETKQTLPPFKRSLKSIPSILLSVLIALFPKCPLCWAAYMSMFGSVGLVNLPYMGWLLPVLFVFLGIHLYLLYQRSEMTGPLPFQLSLSGAFLIILGKFVFSQTWVLFIGMSLLIIASLMISWHSIPTFIKTTQH